MTELVIASSEADARAAEALEQHHAELAGALAARTGALLSAAARRDGCAAEAARAAVVDWCRGELVPHSAAEEETLYPVARRTVEGRLLSEGMRGEHALLVGLVDQVATTLDPVRAAAAATAQRVVFESHLAKENDLLMPLLVVSPEVSVAELLAGMHELIGEAAEQLDVESGRSGHGGGCGEADAPGYPELDARGIPHAIRHATIFGALDGLDAGSGIELVAPHDPLPLVAQVERRWPGSFAVVYLERGPDAWRLRFVRG